MILTSALLGGIAPWRRRPPGSLASRPNTASPVAGSSQKSRSSWPQAARELTLLHNCGGCPLILVWAVIRPWSSSGGTGRANRCPGSPVETPIRASTTTSACTTGTSTDISVLRARAVSATVTAASPASRQRSRPTSSARHCCGACAVPRFSSTAVVVCCRGMCSVTCPLRVRADVLSSATSQATQRVPAHTSQESSPAVGAGPDVVAVTWRSSVIWVSGTGRDSTASSTSSAVSTISWLSADSRPVNVCCSARYCPARYMPLFRSVQEYSSASSVVTKPTPVPPATSAATCVPAGISTGAALATVRVNATFVRAGAAGRGHTRRSDSTASRSLSGARVDPLDQGGDHRRARLDQRGPRVRPVDPGPFRH